MLGDGAGDAVGEVYGGAAVFAGDGGLRARADGVQERFGLGAEGFDVNDLEFLVLDEFGVVELGEVGELAGANLLAQGVKLGFVGGLGDDDAGLFLVIEGDVGRRRRRGASCVRS